VITRSEARLVRHGEAGDRSRIEHHERRIDLMLCGPGDRFGEWRYDAIWMYPDLKQQVAARYGARSSGWVVEDRAGVLIFREASP
jgi:hypothetical protein